MKLSILICTLYERKSYFDALVNSLIAQRFDSNEVEILYEIDNREITTGEKRNKLLERAKGKYSVFIDDDDEVPDYYIAELLKAYESDTDCFDINGIMTTNGGNIKKFVHGRGLPYCADYSTGKEVYLRYPNHITPIRTEIAKQIKFPHITIGEDYAWATKLRDSGLIKTSYLIEPTMYHYKFIDSK
jgi:glycosyltransferase involved in cell wall biosynthesis